MDTNRSKDPIVPDTYSSVGNGRFAEGWFQTDGQARRTMAGGSAAARSGMRGIGRITERRGRVDAVGWGILDVSHVRGRAVVSRGRETSAN